MSEIIKHNGKETFSILVVDDELGIQDFLQRALSKSYALVEVAGSAELFRIFGLNQDEEILDAFIQVVHP